MKLDYETLPARVNGKTARAILAVNDYHVWRKILDANPQLEHRINGEVRPKYLTRELLVLLARN